MFQQQVAPTQSEVDHCNDLANQFTTDDIVLSHRNVARLEDLNRRSEALLINFSFFLVSLAGLCFGARPQWCKAESA